MPNASPERKNQEESAEAPPHLDGARRQGLVSRVKSMLLPASTEADLMDSIEGYMDKSQENGMERFSDHEKALFTNIFKLREKCVDEVMIPRADIVAVEVNSNKETLMELLSTRQFSRIPVYEGSLDDVLGTVHLKDIVGILAKEEDISLRNLVTDVPIVSPFMPVLDLLMTMRDSRRHMALVVDEFGGIDGLVTIGDVIESIVGEVEDEHDTDEDIQILQGKDGSLTVDARVDIEDFEDQYGTLFSHDEREENDTLGGLIFMLAGRVPARGEILQHESGTIFEIVDADRRRVKRIRIRNIPQQGYESAAPSA